MSGLKVIAYLNTKQWMFCIEAQEGPNKDKIISRVEEFGLRKARLSRDKSKVGAVLGLWEKNLDASSAARQIFGSDENAYVCQDIKFDFGMERYIDNDLPKLFEYDEDPLTYMELDNDPVFKQEVKQNEMELLYLHADEDSQNVTGFFCKWKRGYKKTERQNGEEDISVSDDENRVKLFPKGTDPEEIIEWCQGAPTDQIQEIRKKADTEDIKVAMWYRAQKRSYLTAFLNSKRGMVCHDSTSMEPSFWGDWDEDNDVLQVDYGWQVESISLDGRVELEDEHKHEDEEEDDS